MTIAYIRTYSNKQQTESQKRKKKMQHMPN